MSAARPKPGLPAGLPHPRAVLFDWDNTLVDNWATITMALNATFDAFSLPTWTLAETKARARASVRERFPAMFGPDWERARDIFYGAFREKHLEGLSALPGANELLAGLKERGLYLGVVSNKHGPFLRDEAAHLGWTGHFGGIVGAADCPQDKPACDPVERALEPSGLQRGPAVWFVGDADIDMECAYNAGCTGILLHAETAEAAADFRQRPALHLKDCRALLALLAEA
ncbi:MAG: HAD family hydrolase [Alphaproteobacteria bacterium]|nr:HAD family hydrolase [Alphaproteobacteria bacterium]